MFCVNAPLNNLKFDQVIAAFKGVNVHMIKQDRGLLLVSLRDEEIAKKLVQDGLTISEQKLYFAHGKERGSLVRLFDLPIEATENDIKTALDQEVGEVLSVYMQAYRGTTIKNGYATARVNVQSASNKTKSINIGGQQVRMKIENKPLPTDLPQSEDTANETPNKKAKMDGDANQEDEKTEA